MIRKKLKLTTIILLLSILFSFPYINLKVYAKTASNSNSTYAEYAEFEEKNNEKLTEYNKLSREKISIEKIEEFSINNIERNYSGKLYNITENIKTYNSRAAINADPNYAYAVTHGMIVQESIETANEMLWYGFSIDTLSKISIYLNSEKSLDSDIYMFALNQDTYQLELIGGSAIEGQGISEYFNHVMESGTYYFAVTGFESTGTFTFGYYQSNIDTDYEINDTLEEATTVAFNKNINGIIDNPRDFDFYKITVSKTILMEYSISSSDGYKISYRGDYSGKSKINKLKNYDNLYEMQPGTHYFLVYSPNGNYSATSTYTINFKKWSDMTSDSSANLIAIYEDAGFFYQTNKLGTVSYINGKPVDISYSYHFDSYNATGTQNYNITIDTSSDVYVSVHEDYYPLPVYYHTSTQPAIKVSGRAALQLTYYGTSTSFYVINCKGTGAYEANTCKRYSDSVTVLIDPESGKMIDILEYNYFYHYEPSGVNDISCTSPYKRVKLEEF